MTKRTKDIALPRRFRVKFWADQDQRAGVVREIKKRYLALRADCAAESAQKDVLCQRAAFITLQLETAEVEAVQHGRLDWGQYIQAVNSLIGLLKALGLEKRVKKTVDLKAYMRERRA